MSGPHMKDLVGESQSFIVANKRFVLEYLRPYLAALIASEAVVSIGHHYLEAFQIFRILSAFFYGCFFLSWLRTVMLGPDAAHAVQPFNLKPGEGGFVIASWWMGALPLVAAAVSGIVLGIIGVLNKGLMVVCVIPCIAAMIYGFYLSGELMFTLPARAIGKRISFAESKQLSRGLVWKFIGAGTLWTVLVCIAIGLWAVLLDGIMFSLIGLNDDNFIGYVVSFVATDLPAAAGNIALLALTATILGRLYQWAERGLSGP